MTALSNLAAKLRPTARPSACGLVGVHFSRDTLTMLQLRRGDGKRLALQSMVALPLVGSRQQLLESKSATRRLIRRGLKSGRFRGRRVIATLPLEHVKLLSVAYPAVAPDAEPASIARLMADRVDGDLSDYVIDYVPVRTSIRDGERLCMVAVSRREHVINYLDCLDGAGLNVEALEVAPLSVRRLIEAMATPNVIETVLAINTTDDRTYLSLISGRRLLANQEVAFGEQQLVESIAKALGVNPEVAQDLLATNGLRSSASNQAGDEDDLGIGNTLLEIVRPEFVTLVREIERAFLYAASESYGAGTNRIYLIGGLARWRGAEELLGSLVNMPVDRLTEGLLPFDVGDNAASGSKTAELAVASGLALWGLGNDD